MVVDWTPLMTLGGVICGAAIGFAGNWFVGNQKNAHDLKMRELDYHHRRREQRAQRVRDACALHAAKFSELISAIPNLRDIVDPNVRAEIDRIVTELRKAETLVRLDPDIPPELYRVLDLKISVHLQEKFDEGFTFTESLDSAREYAQGELWKFAEATRSYVRNLEDSK